MRETGTNDCNTFQSCFKASYDKVQWQRTCNMAKWLQMVTLWGINPSSKLRLQQILSNISYYLATGIATQGTFS
jgi:hypothetical protein